MDLLKSHRVFHTEASVSSSDSYSLPSPQLVEKSGRSSAEAFFYEVEDSSRLDRTEKVKSWTRGLEPMALKRYLEPLQARKLTTVEVKQRETAVKTANLIRLKQRAFSPLLTLEKPLRLTTRQSHIEQETRRSEAKPFPTHFTVSRLKRTAESTRKGELRTETSTGLGVTRAGQTKVLRKVPICSNKTVCLKPLRSLTPQIGRHTKGLQKVA